MRLYFCFVGELEMVRSEKCVDYIMIELFVIKLLFYIYIVYILFVKKNIFDNVINMIVKCLIYFFMLGFYFCKVLFLF